MSDVGALPGGPRGRGGREVLSGVLQGIQHESFFKKKPEKMESLTDHAGVQTLKGLAVRICRLTDLAAHVGA